jgi:hypothetical protein
MYINFKKNYEFLKFELHFHNDSLEKNSSTLFINEKYFMTNI